MIAFLIYCQGYTNPGGQVARATKFYVMEADMCVGNQCGLGFVSPFWHPEF